MKTIHWVFAAVLVGLSGISHADDQEKQQKLQQAGELIKQHQFTQAYQTLQPLENQLAGDPAYDYLLGQAALGAGHRTEAVVAYERCQLVQPEHHYCRLGMAQAMVALNEHGAARDELQDLRQQQLSPTASQLVEDYLGQLTSIRQIGRPRYTGWVELSAGHNNNTNYAPSRSLITLPDSSYYPGHLYRTARDSGTFTRLKARFAVQLPVAERWDVFAGMTAQTSRTQKLHHGSRFDKDGQLDAWAGGSLRLNRHRLGSMLQVQSYHLHGKKFRDLHALTLQHGYIISTRTRLDSYLQLARQNYRFKQHNGSQDLNTTLLGFTLSHALPGENRMLFGSLHTGRDRKARSAAHSSIGSNYSGLRSGLIWGFGEGWHVGANILLEQRRYQGRYHERYLGSFGKRRKDLRSTTELELAWQIQPRLSLRAQYSYTDNHSTINIRKYDRQIASMGVRYELF